MHGGCGSRGNAMNQSGCGKLTLMAITLFVLASSAVQADETTQFLLVRQAGKADCRYVIERSTPQPNGDILYDLVDPASGRHFQATDKRVIKTAGPLVIQAAFSSTAQRDAEMISALAASPFTASANQKHVPTLAEQAPGGQAIPRLGLFRLLEKKPQSNDSNSHPQQ
jgi:hypothetical protein